jgi:hypothetical protein
VIFSDAVFGWLFFTGKKVKHHRKMYEINGSSPSVIGYRDFTEAVFKTLFPVRITEMKIINYCITASPE